MEYKQLLNALNSYKSDYYNVAQDTLSSIHPDANITESDILNEMELIIKEDLADTGFTEEEIEQVLEQSLDNDVAYKFMAYFCSLYNDYTSSNELMKLIEENQDLDLDEFTEEDIDEIFLASKTLK